MYSVDQIIGSVRTPKRVLRKLNMQYHRRRGDTPYNADGIDVVDQDWDTLIILDACRYDMFASLHDLPGELDKVTSRGSCTLGYFSANFANQEMHDTVYVTGNPMVYEKSIPTDFHTTVEVWMEEGWDEETNTVLPETMTQYAKQAAEDYPDKRLVVHYIQPHYPFITAPTDWDKDHLHRVHDRENTVGFWEHKFRGELNVPKNDIWNYYKANLEAAVPHVKELMTAIDGKTVVTSDHGNMVGERSHPLPYRGWGHPMHVYTEQLVKVPWLVHESGERRDITAEPPEDTETDAEEEDVKEKLEQLGYM